MAYRWATFLKQAVRVVSVVGFFSCFVILLVSLSKTRSELKIYPTKHARWNKRPRYLRWEDDVHETPEQFLNRSILTPHDYKYLHNVPQACAGRKVMLLMVTPSAPDNFRRRRHVRRSEVGVYARNHSDHVVHLFFLGAPQNGSEVQRNVDAEAVEYGDIVQEDFLDVYKNITLKAVSMLKWASLFCADSELVLRTDDDVTVDVEKLVSSLREVYSSHKNFVLGTVAANWDPVRNNRSKYFTSRAQYAYKQLPTFVLGGLMGYPTSTVKLLYRASLRLRRFWLDDVYISGMCAYMVNATVLGTKGFVFHHGFQENSTSSS